jgi:hypothetical protein
VKARTPPRRSGFKFGKRTYVVFTRFADQKTLKRVIAAPMLPGDRLDGCWENKLGEDPKKPWKAGYIYIAKTLSPLRRWTTYDHELRHAFHDILAWDGEN